MHILLIARHYPPEISGGARRPYLYTKALRALGHKVTVVTPFPSDDIDHITVASSSIDRGRDVLSSKPQDAAPKPKPLNLRSYMRLWLYWPDDNITWARSVIKTMKATNIKPDWIMTTNPPESSHVVGSRLAKYFKVPWVAEFRDTWVEAPHREIIKTSRIRRYIESVIAHQMLKSADAVTAVSDVIMKEALGYVPDGTPHLIISHFSDEPPAPMTLDPSSIHLVHTGGFTLSDHRRKLSPLLSVLNDIRATHSGITFHIAGPLSADEQTIIKNDPLDIVWHGTISLTEARSLQAAADALILHTPEDSHALPGKYAEYAMVGRPIYYLGGGSWLDLVPDKSNLRPLDSVNVTIKKGEISPVELPLTHKEAAERLASFLQNIPLKSS